MRTTVNALLWRSCNKATFDSLHGNSTGQYDIRFTRDPAIASFFEGLEQDELTEHGGYTLHALIAPFDGPDPVAEFPLDVRYMGPNSIRKDWYMPSQRPDTAYPLWRPGRGVPESFKAATSDYVLLVRDVDNAFHARWLRGTSLTLVPANVREAILSRASGVLVL